MDGFRCTETGETDVTMSSEEAAAMLVAVNYALAAFCVHGCADTAKHMSSIQHTLKQLGVTMDG